MLMWEIFAGHPPFSDKAHNCDLMFNICAGLRPSLLPGMPGDYVQMMQRCWDMDPAKRPTIGELWNFAKNKHDQILNNNNNYYYYYNTISSSSDLQKVHISIPTL